MDAQVELTVEEIYNELNDSQIFEMICLLIENEEIDFNKVAKGEYTEQNANKEYIKNKRWRTVTFEADNFDVDIWDAFEDLSHYEKQRFITELKDDGWFEKEEQENALEEDFDYKISKMIGKRRYISPEDEKKLLEIVKTVDF